MIIIQHRNRVIKSTIFTLLLCSLPIIAQATEIDTSIEGYTGILNMLKVYVRGSGAIVLMIGTADFFISLSQENTDRLVKSMYTMGAGFFLILADSLVQSIGNANGSQAFATLLSMTGLIISFIGAVLTMLGAYKVIDSIKERNSESKSKGIKVLFSGLMLVVISQSLSNFFL